MASRPVYVVEHLSPRAFAARISVSVSTVRRELKLGRLRKTKIGRRVVIAADQANKWLEAHTV
jgi:excisionase family DNA binding protein